MCNDQYHTTPRLYSELDLKEDATVTLNPDQTHYLGHVLRKAVGGQLRLFNERAGEFIGTIASITKKQIAVVLRQQIRQPIPLKGAGLVFSPLKKDRLHFLLEKATELGVAWLQPILCDRTTLRHFNDDKARKIIIEAAEQCERLTLPILKPLETLARFLVHQRSYTLWACIERSKMSSLTPEHCFQHGDAFLIGPEGGFTPNELDILQTTANLHPLSLGADILRAETAGIMALSLYKGFVKNNAST